MIFERLSLEAAYQVDCLKEVESEKLDDATFQVFQFAGADRSFDKASDTYGNSFSDFTKWPEDYSMNEQEQAEYFMFLFLQSALAGSASRLMDPEEFDAIIFMLRRGWFLEACSWAGRRIKKQFTKKGETDGEKISTSEDHA